MVSESFQYRSVDQGGAEIPSPQARIMHLSGMFEVGGSMWLHIQQRTTPQPGRTKISNYVYPMISMNDSVEGRLVQLMEVYGGNKRRQTQNSWTWTVSGQKAHDYASAMNDCSPSRQSVIEAFSNVASPSSSFEEKKEIARRNKGAVQDFTVPKEVYLPLIRDPHFLGGVFDSRAIYMKYRDVETRTKVPTDSVVPKIDISSRNLGLLQAIGEELGGSIQLSQPAGTEIRINGENPRLSTHDSYTWSIRGDVYKLLHFLHEHSYTRREDIQAILH